MPSSNSDFAAGEQRESVALPSGEAAVTYPAAQAETGMAPDVPPGVEGAAVQSSESGSAEHDDPSSVLKRMTPERMEKFDASEHDSPASDAPSAGLLAIQERRALLMRRIENAERYAASARESERLAALERENELGALRERLNESQAQLAPLRERLALLESERELAAEERQREADGRAAEALDVQKLQVELQEKCGKLQEENAGARADVEALRRQLDVSRLQLEESREGLRIGSEREAQLREQLGEAVRELEAKHPPHVSLPVEPCMSGFKLSRINISGKKAALFCVILALLLAGAVLCWTYLQAAPPPAPADLIDPLRVPDANATLSGTGGASGLLPEKKADGPPPPEAPASGADTAGQAQAATVAAALSVPAAEQRTMQTPAAAPALQNVSAGVPAAASVPAPGSIPATTGATAGKVEKLTRLRADLTEYELLARLKEFEVKIHEQDAKLRQVDMPPVILPAPSAPLAPALARPSVPTRVASVQGIDGKMTARIRLSSGKMVFLRPGEKFSGGVVAGIDRNGVRIRRNGKITSIPFE